MLGNMPKLLKLTLALFLGLVLLWVLNGQLRDQADQIPSQGHAQSAPDEQELIEPASAGMDLGPTAHQDVIRGSDIEPATKLIVFNWLEERVPEGRLYFANQDMAVQGYLSRGSVSLPAWEWTHVLISIQNHAPYLATRESLPISGGSVTVQMPDPTFQARVETPNQSLLGVKLRVDFPWVETASWPKALQETFPLPKSLPLAIDAPTQMTYFVGAPGTSTTVQSHGEFLIETPEGLKQSVAYSAGAVHEVLLLSHYPQLTLTMDPGQLSPVPDFYHIEVRLRGNGVSDHQFSHTLPALPEDSWRIPYNPSFTEADVTVRDQREGNQLGGAKIPLEGRDQEATILLEQSQLVLSVLNSQGNGVADAMIVQAGATIGITDPSGTTSLNLSDQAGEVWILSRDHDAIATTVDALVANPVVTIQDATGLVLEFSSAEAATAFASAGDLNLQGIGFSPVYEDCPKQAPLVYGLTVSYGEGISGPWGTSFSYVFSCIPDVANPETVRAAGVFEVTQETEVQLVIQDSHLLEAHRESVTIYPNQITSIPMPTEDLFETIEVRIADAEGNALAGAEVSTGPWAGIVTINSDREGLVQLTVANKAEVELLTQMPGYVEARTPWPLPEQGRVIHLQKARKLTVQILDAHGTRTDQEMVLTDGNRLWFGAKRSEGVYEFEAVPISELRAQLRDSKTAKDWIVAPEITNYTLQL